MNDFTQQQMDKRQRGRCDHVLRPFATLWARLKTAYESNNIVQRIELVLKKIVEGRYGKKKHKDEGC